MIKNGKILPQSHGFAERGQTTSSEPSSQNTHSQHHSFTPFLFLLPSLYSPILVCIIFASTMKEALKQSKCDIHTLPIIKIQTQTRRLLCQKCLSESDDERRQRLQFMRIRLNKRYQMELNELKLIKEQTDRMLDLFQTKNMVQAKKLINKASSQVQRIVETLLEREVKQANKILKEAADSELQKWKGIDNRHFNSTYLDFEDQAPRIEQKLTELKHSLKLQIAQKLKHQLRNFYSNLFEF